MQMWVGLLPSSQMPYVPTKHSPDWTYSARLTIIKHKLRLEYPDRNIEMGKKLTGAKLQFLAHSDTVEMGRALISFLPADISDKELFSKKFPLLVDGERQFVVFCSSGREKEDLYRALMDSSTYMEDGKLDLLRSTNCSSCLVGGRETQGERRAKFVTYIKSEEGGGGWRERGEVCQCQVEPLFDNDSLVFINSLIRRIFYYVSREQFFVDFIHRKIVGKLLKIKFHHYLPKYCVEDISCGKFPPVVVDVFRPYQDKQGIFLPVKVEYQGVSSVKISLHNEGKGSGGISRTIIGRIKNFFLGNICLKLEVLYLKGHICYNIAQEQTDRVWFGFSTEPEMELQLVLMFGEKRIQNLLVDKLLQVILKRMREEFKNHLVLPNMDDIRVKFLK